MFDYLVAHGRMKEKEARAKFRQVQDFIRSVLVSHLPWPCLSVLPGLPVQLGGLSKHSDLLGYCSLSDTLGDAACSTALIPGALMVSRAATLVTVLQTGLFFVLVSVFWVNLSSHKTTGNPVFLTVVPGCAQALSPTALAHSL